jgi:hypothetical protein
VARSAELAEPASVTPLRPGLPSATGRWRPGAPSLFLGAVGFAQAAVFGASGLFGGYYDFAVWGVLSAVTLVTLAAALVVRPEPPSGPALVMAGGLLALLVLSALSLTWADSVDRAWTEVNRLVLYLATLLLAGVVLRPGRSVRVFAGVIGAAIGVCALITLARLLAGDAGAFLIHRLDAPVDYINGTACLMLMGIWPLVALAERDRRPLLAGLGVGLASVEASLLVLTQSRAVIPALLGSGILMLALIPGRLARLWTLVAVGVGVGAALPWTLAVYADIAPGHPDSPSAAAVARAGVATLLAAAAAGLLWALARALAARPLPPALRRAPRVGAAGLALAVALALLVAFPHPARSVRNQWRAFTSLQIVAPTARVRFTDVGGYRYDLWRVAVDEFEQHPVRGVGAGSYALRFYQLRRDPQPVRQPHSIEFQMLAELGLPGLLALLVFVGGIGWALVRSRRRDVGLSVALGGMSVVWLLHTSVDWVYNMPGLTGMALLAAAGLGAIARGNRGPVEPARPAPAPAAPTSAPPSRAAATAPTPAPPRAPGPVPPLPAAVAASALPAPRPRGRDRRIVGWTLGVIALVALGAPSLVRQYLAQERSDRAASLLATDPRAALRETQAALRLNDSSPETLYTRAAAYARLGDYGDARDTLLEAVRIEPLNYVPWVLLGDLATRRGDTARAGAAYARARALDPGDAAEFTSTPPASG